MEDACKSEAISMIFPTNGSVAALASLTMVTADSDARINFASAVAAQDIGSQDCSGDLQLGRDSLTFVSNIFPIDH